MRFRTPPCNRTWPPGPLGPGCTPSAMPESSSSMPRRRQRFRVTCVSMPRRQSAGNQSPVRVAFADRCSSRDADLRIRPRRSRRSLPRARLGQARGRGHGARQTAAVLRRKCVRVRLRDEAPVTSRPRGVRVVAGRGTSIVSAVVMAWWSRRCSGAPACTGYSPVGLVWVLDNARQRHAALS